MELYREYPLSIFRSLQESNMPLKESYNELIGDEVVSFIVLALLSKSTTIEVFECDNSSVTPTGYVELAGTFLTPMPKLERFASPLVKSMPKLLPYL
jgi:hypothetical protein